MVDMTRFFDPSRSSEPLTIADVVDTINKVEAYRLSLARVIQVRGDTDGNTVKGGQILVDLASALQHVAKFDLKSNDSVSAKGSDVPSDDVFVATSVLGKR